MAATVKRETAGGQGRPPAVKLKTHIPSVIDSAAVESAVSVVGQIEGHLTKVLVDTGSAVTIVSEEMWKGATGNQQLEEVSRSVVAANGEQL